MTSKNPLVRAALQDYLDRVDQGERIDVEAFVVRHPNVAEELRSFIALDLEARRQAGGAAPVVGSPPGAPINKPSPKNAEVSTHSVVGSMEETIVGSPKSPGPQAGSASVEKSAGDLPEVFGRYRVQKKLGSGAMGAVYLADDTLLHRKVALKTPTFEDDKDSELLRRFYREARAVANLKHPNLCAVYDVGEIDGRHYISMEFVQGKKLQDYIKPDKPMAEKQVMAVVRKIALAMQVAHTHGVIHRDLKPDNIMVNEKGEPVVMDFGLVHKTESKNSTRITQRGMLVGSPAYMSKEQVEGDSEKLTGATDQYSLGVILYQLLTSKLPFEGGIHGVLAAILTKEPAAPSQIRPSVNPHLEAVCLKMMAKEASNRYPSMKAVADALAGVARGTATTAGASVLVRPADGSPRESTPETTLDPAPAPGAADEFDFNSPLEPPPARKVRRRRPAPPPRALLIGGLSAGLVLLAAIVWIVIGDSRVKVEILAEGYEVKFNEAEITITDGTRETRVKPGDHTLHIKSSKPGDDGVMDEFDTEQLTLKKGGKPVIVVTREDSEVVAKLDGKPIPRRSLTAGSTGQSNASTTKVPDANEKTLIYETSDELIKNGSGADAGPGGIVGWKVLSGQWDKTYIWFKPGPPAYLVAGDVPSGAIEQDVDVSRFANAIDSSNVEFKLSWKLQCFDSDVGRLELIPLDQNRKELAASYDSGWENHESPTDWKRFEKTIFPVKGVRYVRARLSSKRSSRPGNVTCTAYIREISLRAIVKEPFTAPKVRDDGPWISLFNGKDLTGWKIHPSQPGGWTVEDGLLVGRSWDANHLFTEIGDFGDIHLRAELKTENQSNSGIFFRSPFALDRGGKFPSGYEAQILHSSTKGPWTGSLMIPGVPGVEQLPHERLFIGVGEWFTMDVIAVGNVFTVKVNGKTTTNISDGNNLYRTGHLALQAMVDKGITMPTIVHFKKIEVKQLKVAAPPVADAP